MGGCSQSFLGNLVTPQSRGFAGRLRAPQNTSRPPHQQPGIARLSHRESPELQARPLPVPSTLATAELGASLCGSPQILGRAPTSERCLQGEGLELSQLRGLAALLLPGNHSRGGARQQLMGCPKQGVYTHGVNLTPPSIPLQTPRPFPVPTLYCFMASPLAASPRPGVYLVLIYFPPFVDKRCWLGCSPRALFLSGSAGKGKCHPVLCLKGIINSGQLCLNLPVLPGLQSWGFRECNSQSVALPANFSLVPSQGE